MWLSWAVFTLGVIQLVALTSAQTDKYTDENRPYKFGFNIEGHQHRKEEKDEKGIIKGEYGFITADGYYRVTEYATDEKGDFKIISMKNYYVGFPPGDPTTTPGPNPRVAAQVTTTTTTTQAPTTAAPTTTTTTEIPSTTRGLGRGGQACSSCFLPPTTTQKPKQPSLLTTGKGPFNQTPTGPPLQPQLGINSQGPARSPLRPGSGIHNQTPTQYQSGLRPTQKPILDEKPSLPVVPPVLGGDFILKTNVPNDINTNTKDQITKNRGNQNSITKNQINSQSINQKPTGEITKNINQPNFEINNDINLNGDQPGLNQLSKTNEGATNEPNDLLYTFNYTVGFHGHHEDGYRNGDKKGDYFVNDRDGDSRRVEYVANEFGYQPNITLVRLDKNDENVPKEETEKDYGLKGYEFKWFYRK